ncbi:hypothetical protein DFH94DRAFT_385690 [Russula ochroleuca]|uniref:Uncharacterized protein n=1 Tax=Russula ochroleuca TaxID=152965 RepID=A0A9P5N091_9AGAM|nr:hypothetical protein DFH94DRAFT_385690 [Russula ochroleuca]
MRLRLLFQRCVVAQRSTLVPTLPGQRSGSWIRFLARALATPLLSEVFSSPYSRQASRYTRPFTDSSSSQYIMCNMTLSGSHHNPKNMMPISTSIDPFTTLLVLYYCMEINRMGEARRFPVVLFQL